MSELEPRESSDSDELITRGRAIFLLSLHHTSVLVVAGVDRLALLVVSHNKLPTLLHQSGVSTIDKSNDADPQLCTGEEAGVDGRGSFLFIIFLFR